MTLLAPLGLLALLSIPILILFYLLKVRYRDHEVGSTYLWEQLTRDLAVHEPWQKPRLSILLFIQALLLGVLALALARPTLVTGAAERVHAVVLLDGSASMNATDVAPTRFDRARSLAREATSRLPDGSTGTVILAGAHPEVLAAETADRSRLLGAIDGAQATDAAGDPAAALRMAVALARGRPNGQVLVFSDGAFEAPGVDTTGAKVVYSPVGGGDDNRAIVAVEARPEPQNNRRYQAFVRVQNYADHPADATVSLRADGQLVDSQGLHLEAAGSGAAVFADLPLDARVLEARLLEPDALTADNRGWSVLERRRPTQVLLVTRGNLFLERALALIPDVELFRIAPRRLGAIDEATYDVVVFDGTVPDVPPRRPILVVNHQDVAWLPVRGLARRAAPLTWNADDPLLRYVDLRDVRVSRMVQIAPPTWARSVVESDGQPAILAGETDGRRVVVFAFDLQGSNLPLSASFPILMANVLGYLEPPRALDQPVARPGGVLNVVAQAGAEEVDIRGDAGVVGRLDPRGSLQVDAPMRVGLYAVEQLANRAILASEPFAVNLADPVESDLRPRTLALPDGGASAPGGLPGGREVWTYAILAAASLLTLEWWWFHRRA
jgi:Ca-activated chloride channel family protein